MHVSARVSDALGNKLKEIAEKTGRTESYYIKLALAKVLEDYEDYSIAMAALENKDDAISWEEAKEQLGLSSKKKQSIVHVVSATRAIPKTITKRTKHAMENRYVARRRKAAKKS